MVGLGPDDRRRGDGLGDGGQARVRVGLRGCELGEDLGDLGWGRAGRHTGAVETAHLGQAHPRLGEGPGLVRADDVDACQALDGRQLLDEALALPEPDDPDREGNRRHEHEAFGDHRDQRGDHARQALAPRLPEAEQLGPDRQQADRDEQPRDDEEDPVDPVAQLGPDEGELGGLLDDPRGIRLAADLRRAVGAGTGDDETAREHLIAGPLDDRVGLASEQRLVDLQAGRFEHVAIDDELVAGAELDDVVGDDVGASDRAAHPVAPDGRAGLADDREVVQGALGAQLLDDPDRAVGDDEQPEGGVDEFAGREDDDQQDAEDGVDPGEDVGPDDLASRASAAGGHVIRAPVAHPIRHFCAGQAGMTNVRRDLVHGWDPR